MRRRAAPSSYQVWWRKHPDWNPGRGCIFCTVLSLQPRFGFHSCILFVSSALFPSLPRLLQLLLESAIKFGTRSPARPERGWCVDHQHVKEMHPSNFVVAIAFRIFRFFFFSGCFCYTVFARKLPDHYTLPSPRDCATISKGFKKKRQNESTRFG